jgi:group II intron reverse transcriptase/maturase
MSGAKTSKVMSTGLTKVVERARNHPQERILSLAHRIDVSALERAYGRLRNDAAVGVDGVTKADYGQDLESNLQGLHERLRTMQWRHQPIRRVHIPKGAGKTRPIGISTVEDKLVQDAVREVLEAIYEQDFLSCSYGFRPGRRAHDALRVLNQAVFQGAVNWIIEADIVSYFDSLDRTKLMEMLRSRVADESLMRLIGKCLHVGVLDGAEYSEPEVGTPQGSVLSPLLGNVYLHYALDLWFEHEIKPRLRGRVFLIRYADDVVIAFELREDAERVMAVLHKRLGRFELTLHPDKTRLLPFGRPKAGSGKGPATFDLLGFTLYWKRTRRGRWQMACKTKRASLRRAIRSVYEYCRSHRHYPVKEQHAALASRLRGHFNYFGVNGNSQSLWSLRRVVERIWHYWLRRRSQRTRLTWERYAAYLKRHPLPAPRITIQIWGA